MKGKMIIAVVIAAAVFLTVEAWLYPRQHPESLPSTRVWEERDTTEDTVPDSYSLGRNFEVAPFVFGNPLMGYAEQAEEEEIGDETNLVYIDITWREWEPEMDQYDIEGVMKTNQIDRWKAEGKHAVLRFICDLPSEVWHMDIPDWLYKTSGNAGIYYQTGYGFGYSPDYSNAYIQQRHAAAVRALGVAFGQDTFISYIEMGSLGHWGEWHVNFERGIPRLPNEEIRDAYVTPWQEAFPNAKILMRRPFTIAASQGFGLYNDIIGNAAGTKEWLNWIQVGGNYDQTIDIADTLKPMPEFWKTAPSGGELTSSISMESMMTEKLTDVLLQLKDSHTTFIGPNIAPPEYANASNAILGVIGYKLYIMQAELVQKNGNLSLTTVWTNNGIAPIYWNWPIYIYVKDEDGSIIGKTPVDIRLSRLLPGDKLTNSTHIDIPQDIDASACSYWIGIEDPMTMKPSVYFNMNTEQADGMARLF